MTAYAALAEPSRRQILDLLRERERRRERARGPCRASASPASPSTSRCCARPDSSPSARTASGASTACAARRSPRSPTGSSRTGGHWDAATRRTRTPPQGEPMMSGTQETIDGRPCAALRAPPPPRHRARLARGQRAGRARPVVRRPRRLGSPEEGETFEAAGDSGRGQRSSIRPNALAWQWGDAERYRFELSATRRRHHARLHPRLQAARSARTGSTRPAGRPTSTGSTRTSPAATSPRKTRTRTSRPSWTNTRRRSRLRAATSARRRRPWRR